MCIARATAERTTQLCVLESDATGASNESTHRWVAHDGGRFCSWCCLVVRNRLGRKSEIYKGRSDTRMKTERSLYSRYWSAFVGSKGYRMPGTRYTLYTAYSVSADLTVFPLDYSTMVRTTSVFVPSQMASSVGQSFFLNYFWENRRECGLHRPP